MNKEMRISVALGVLFIFGFMVGIVSAENNEFTSGDDINVYSRGCQYQNKSNLSQWVDCDSNVECRISALYPNKTLLINDALMTRSGSDFNYSFGLEATLGSYPATMKCLFDDGWVDIPFVFTIADEDGVVPGSKVGSSLWSSGGDVLNVSQELNQSQIEAVKAEVIRSIFPYLLATLLIIIVLFILLVVWILRK